MFAGGETEMKPVISGRRISSCIPIQAPKLKPATQQCLAFWFIDWVIERRGGVTEFADPLVVFALAAPDTAEIEPQHGETHVMEGVVQIVDDAIVHRAAELRMRMQHDGDRRVAVLLRVVTAFETALGPWKNDFGHGLRSVRPLGQAFLDGTASVL